MKYVVYIAWIMILYFLVVFINVKLLSFSKAADMKTTENKLEDVETKHRDVCIKVKLFNYK